MVKTSHFLMEFKQGGRSSRKCPALFYTLIIIRYAEISKVRCPPGTPEGEADGYEIFQESANIRGNLELY